MSSSGPTPGHSPGPPGPSPFATCPSLTAPIAACCTTSRSPSSPAAARAANAHEFITRFPQGYQTQVGERGVQLSGGQRQRIAIARAFLKDSPVLILDEPTSAVDQEAEAAIVDAIRRLMRGRTVILITHRPRLLERCTALVVLENGRLVSDMTRAAPLVVPVARRAAVHERQAILMNHPAVHAWRRLYPHSGPQRITPLRVFPRKTMVYRLQ